MDKNRTDFSTMVSVQPFWDAEKSHKSLLTEGNNSTPIAVVHELKSPGKADGLSCVPGIGLVGILFSTDPNNPYAVCCGALNQSKKVPLYGMLQVFACQFFPGEFTRIFGIPSNELADTEIPLDDLLQPGSILEQMAYSKTFEQRIKYLRNFILQWENRTKQRETSALIQNMMYDALMQHGNIRISELQEQTGYSARYLQKVITEHVGLAPKTVLANIRFQNALRTMIEHPGMSIVDVAQDCGYYDQSHFAKAFKEYMNMPPSVFQEKIKKEFSPGKLDFITL